MIGKQNNRPRTTVVVSKRRRFVRRRRTWPLLAVVLALAALGALLSAGNVRADGGESVARVATPMVSKAPQAPAEVEQSPQPTRESETSARQASTSGETGTKAEPAAFPPPEDPTLYLTVPRLGLYGHTVRNDDSEWALSQGAVKLPPTGFPWQGGANIYIAGHRIGWPNTESYYQFYNLPAMQNGGLVYLEDANGTVYTYEVSEIFAVSPSDVWVTNPIAGRDMVSLQTCTETPNDWWTIGPRLFESGPESGRLIVRADKVATDYA